MPVPRDSDDIKAMIAARDAITTTVPDTSKLTKQQWDAIHQAAVNSVAPAISTNSKTPTIIKVETPPLVTGKSGTTLTVNRDNNTFTSAEQTTPKAIESKPPVTNNSTNPGGAPVSGTQDDKKKDEEPTSANIKLLVFVSAIAGVALIVYFL